MRDIVAVPPIGILIDVGDINILSGSDALFVTDKVPESVPIVAVIVAVPNSLPLETVVDASPHHSSTSEPTGETVAILVLLEPQLMLGLLHISVERFRNCEIARDGPMDAETRADGDKGFRFIWVLYITIFRG